MILRLFDRLPGDVPILFSEYLELLTALRQEDQRSRQKAKELLFQSVLQVGMLWECAKGNDAWTELSHLSLGVVKNDSGRTLLTPAQYKHAVVVETRNASSHVIRTGRQLIVGLMLAARKRHGVRLRVAERVQQTAASSLLKTSEIHITPTESYKMEVFHQYNYFLCARNWL